MTVERFGQVSTYTILAGVEELLHLGLWPLALLVFFASVVVPMAKLISLAWFLHMIRRRSARWLRERTRLYRFIDFVGRWSNIDVFMVSILAAWLGLRTISDRGPVITISFANAEGIELGRNEAARTTIRYKNVELGRVASLGLSDDKSSVVVTAEMRREAEPLLRSDTKFWVVR